MNSTEHLLVCLGEECAELQQAAAKALRFGLDDGYPNTDRTNAGDIAREFGDLLAVVELLAEAMGVKLGADHEDLPFQTARAVNAKKERVREYMEYARQRGTLEP